jgi:branched-chain amino acid transport system ATP-binding protein
LSDVDVTTELDATSAVDAVAGGRDSLLEVSDLRAGYGSLPVLHGMTFSIGRGEVAVLLGLNGAGKSTTVKALCGALPVTSGRVVYDGADITGWRTAQSVRAGIVLVPEGRHVFADLSVADNLQVGAWARRHDRAWVHAQRDRVYEYLPRLDERRHQLAGTLSGGEQQMLAIGRGLMADPRLLIIDEASLGLAPVIVSEIFRIVSSFTADGTTVILVEQNVGALKIADVGFFVQKGVIEAELRGEELDDTERVRHLYLG